jgi:hypothetical protein
VRPLFAYLTFANPLAVAESAAPTLGTTQAMRVALVTKSGPGCPIDSKALHDGLSSVVHGSGFPETAATSELPDFIVKVTSKMESDLVTCRHLRGARLALDHQVIWEAEIETVEGGIPPSSLNERAQAVLREVVQRFGADWRQCQGR